MVASPFWDIRLSIACAATDAEYRIILHDIHVVARQHRPDSNYAPHTAARLFTPLPEGA